MILFIDFHLFLNSAWHIKIVDRAQRDEAIRCAESSSSSSEDKILPSQNRKRIHRSPANDTNKYKSEKNKKKEKKNVIADSDTD